MKKRTYKVYSVTTGRNPDFIKEIHNVIRVDRSELGYMLEENSQSNSSLDPKSKYHYFPLNTILIEL